MTPLHLRARVRRLPAGDAIVHGVVFLIGSGLIALGVVAVVLPGPLTIPPILLGLAVWALEFEFAEALLAKVRGPAQRAWQDAKARPLRTGLVTVGGLTLMVVAVVLISQLDLIDRARAALT